MSEEMSDPSILRRLSFIKYLYTFGVEQSQKPEPMCFIALLMFHDAMELFLDLSAEKLEINTSNVKFMQYFSKINEKLSDDKNLTQRESSRKLNKARVDLKHHGNTPSKLAIEGFRATATNFFEENSQIVFNINFSNISIAELIKFEKTRTYVQEAERLLNEGLLEASIEQAAIAFECLLLEFFKQLDFSNKYFFFNFDDNRFEIDPELSDSVENINQLNRSVKILSLGLDYLKYIKFRTLTPNVFVMINENFTVQKKNINEGKINIENTSFCILFIIESAIHLQEIEFG